MQRHVLEFTAKFVILAFFLLLIMGTASWALAMHPYDVDTYDGDSGFHSAILKARDFVGEGYVVDSYTLGDGSYVITLRRGDGTDVVVRLARDYSLISMKDIGGQYSRDDLYDGYNNNTYYHGTYDQSYYNTYDTRDTRNYQNDDYYDDEYDSYARYSRADYTNGYRNIPIAEPAVRYRESDERGYLSYNRSTSYDTGESDRVVTLFEELLRIFR